MPSGKIWTRDELLAACNLYFTLPFGQMHSRNPIIIKMAGALGRTPGSIAMKLVNFASLDPTHQARGVSGLKGRSRADREIWEEFRSQWDSAVAESEMVLERLMPTEEPPPRAARLNMNRRANLTQARPKGKRPSASGPVKRFSERPYLQPMERAVA